MILIFCTLVKLSNCKQIVKGWIYPKVHWDDPTFAAADVTNPCMATHRSPLGSTFELLSFQCRMLLVYSIESNGKAQILKFFISWQIGLSWCGTPHNPLMELNILASSVDVTIATCVIQNFSLLSIWRSTQATDPTLMELHILARYVSPFTHVSVLCMVLTHLLHPLWHNLCLYLQYEVGRLTWADPM